MTQEQMKKVLEIGVKLSSERDLDKLLEDILTCVMELARCDAGTLYLLDKDVLRFQVSRNHTLKDYSNGEGMPPVPLEREHVCALSYLEDRTISIEDVYNSREFSFSGPRKYDAKNGYRTQSMLVVPMRGRGGERLGVLQLINAMDGAGRVCPFSQDMALVLESVASQAAITIQNVRYTETIKELFNSFVRVMSTAIDERTRYNAEHSRRMAQCGQRFVDWLNARALQRGEEPPFSPQHKDELIMSIWLHDIGKVTTPLAVMDKEKRLSPSQKDRLDARFYQIGLLDRIRELKGALSPDERKAEALRLSETLRRIEEINSAEFVTDSQLSWLDSVRRNTYTDEEGQTHPWLTEEDCRMLSIRRGTLSPEEMEEMHRHAVITDKLLAQIKFSPELSHVRAWAAAHHENLIGKGYPLGLKGDEIPYEVRIITILDIFDALVAADRPYKKARTVEQALKILSFDVQDGKLDPQLTALFTESRCWEGLYGSV